MHVKDNDREHQVLLHVQFPLTYASYSNNPVLGRPQKELTVSLDLFVDGFLSLSNWAGAGHTGGKNEESIYKQI